MDDSTARPDLSLRLFAGALGAIVAAAGALVLIGWGAGVESLRSLVPGYAVMEANTAAGLVLAGASATLQCSPGRCVTARIAQALAFGALLIGALTLAEHALRLDLGIDELLFRDHGREPGGHPGRMPISSALALSLVGSSLLLLDRETPRGRRPGQLLALAAALIPLQALVGFAYRIQPTSGVSRYTDVAVHSAFAFALLCASALLARPEKGFVRLLTGPGPAAFAARRLLVAIALIPIALGWLFLVVGIRSGHYEALAGATFVVVSAIVTGGAVVWWTARELQRTDEARTYAEEAVRDEREWLGTTLASIGDGVLAAAADGSVKYLNGNAEALTGWPSASAARRPLDDVFRIRGHRGAIESPCAFVLRENRVADLPRDAVLVARSGAEFPVEGCVAPIRDARGRTAGVVVVFRDTRERHRVEEERVALLARERDARADAEKANRAKDEFIATLSHELRTPLNSVLGWARLLRIGKLDADGARRAVEAIERGATTQAQIVDDLLDVARIVRGQMKLDVRPVDLVPVIEAAIDTVRPAAAAREIEIAAVLATRAGQVAGDPGRLQQVVWNLLSNAIKFTPQNGRVEIRLESRDGAVEIEVRDTGSGIPPEFLPHVFERFRQADSSTTRAHGGLGLGLAIVRHLVEGHGGTVAAESAGPGLGSRFTVRLPAMAQPRVRSRAAEDRRAAAASSSGAPDTVASLSSLRVLVVDDDQDTLEVMRQLLESAGAEVIAAASADEALQCIHREVPDVLVSDIGMPGRDGYSLIRDVRRLAPDRGGRMPAAALTAFTQSEHRQQALLAGFQLYLAKPIEPVELTAAVARLAGRSMPPA